MKLVFITNYIHHHQVPLADEFYKFLGDKYIYIAIEPLSDILIRGGYDPSINRPYIVRAYENQAQQEYAKQLAYDADVVIIGSAPESYVERRIRAGKLTFRYSERWFKSKPWFLSGPRAWVNFYKNHIRHNNKPLYMLAASAYTCADVNNIGAYKDKVFRWGYFTRVDDFEINECAKLKESNVNAIPQIMWCARFLRLKHPEIPVKLASRLKNKGYRFQLNMFGSGEELGNTKKLASKLDVNDVVNFCGNLPNEEILVKMREYEMFLFTSDRNEGWGAVLNESMSNGCVVVASNLIGSVPFLINDGENGLIFKSENIDSLEKKVIYLLEHPSERIRMAKNAIMTMRNLWSPQNAARQFMQLVKALNDSDINAIPQSGPCSIAKRV